VTQGHSAGVYSRPAEFIFSFCIFVVMEITLNSLFSEHKAPAKPAFRAVRAGTEAKVDPREVQLALSYGIALYSSYHIFFIP